MAINWPVNPAIGDEHVSDDVIWVCVNNVGPVWEKAVGANSIFSKSYIITEISKQLNTGDAVIDVYIYETSEDEDAGAWTEQLTSTGWYYEDLISLTRGKTRKFPKTVGVVTLVDKVILYDLVDPELPMWMVLPTGAFIQNTPLKKAIMKNGVLYRISNKALDYFDFKLDTMGYINETGTYRKNTGSKIIDRSDVGSAFIKVSSQALKFANLNYIAIANTPMGKNLVMLTYDSNSDGSGGGAIDWYFDYVHMFGLGFDSPFGEPGFKDISFYKNDPTKCMVSQDTFAVFGFDSPVNTVDALNLTGDFILYPDTPDFEAFTMIDTIKVETEKFFGSAHGITKLDLTHDVPMQVRIRQSYNTGYIVGDNYNALLMNSIAANRVINNSAQKDLTVNGAITEELVFPNSDLKCYTGFSAVNYLTQANTITGTGDQLFMFWIEPNDSGVVFSVPASSTEVEVLNNAIKYTEVGGSIITPTDSLVQGEFNFVYIIFKAATDTALIYINNVLQISGVIPKVKIPNSILYVGNNGALSNPLQTSRIALLRLSNIVNNTALSFAQLAQIYLEEHRLFEVGVKCLLKGSNNVLALSYSKSDDILAVSTPADITRFNALVAVSSESKPSTTISRSFNNKELVGV